MNMNDLRAAARDKLSKWCRVCPVCNGRVCAGEVPGMGGTGSGRAFMENIRALEAWKLNMRTLHEVESPELEMKLWGALLGLPVMVAPMTGVANNLGNAVAEDELQQSLYTGANNAGSICWTGDGAAPGLFETGIATMRGLGGRGIPTIKPRGPEEIVKRIRQAEEAGAFAVAVDVDTAGFQSMTAMGQKVGPTRPSDIAVLVRSTKLPLILKGIMTPDEAVLAASLGVRGIVVSNHGGRVFEYSPGTADVLPEIAAAVKGRLKIFLDGGIRKGADVLKALALGADAVLVGRPFIVAAAGGGAAGVGLAMQTLAEELRHAMILTGTPSVKNVSPSILFRQPCTCGV